MISNIDILPASYFHTAIPNGSLQFHNSVIWVKNQHNYAGDKSE